MAVGAEAEDLNEAAPPRWRRRAVVAGGALAVLWLVGVSWTLWGAWQAAESGSDALVLLRRGATPSSLLEDDTRDDLVAAREEMDRARSRLRSPLVAPLRVVPLVGHQIRGGDAVVASARGATDLALEGIEELRAMSERDLGSGPARVTVVEDLADLVARMRQGLAALEPGSGGGLIGPLADGVHRVRVDHQEAMGSLERAEHATRTVAELLAGPSTYLLLGANNAEMRAGGGMFLSAAELRLESGEMSLGEVTPTAEVVLAEGSVEVDEGLAANWPWIDVGRDLRNLGLTADFPQNAEAAVEHWSVLRGQDPVDGVMAVDVEALRGLLRVVGPVEVDGVVYEVDTIRGELLRDQYQRFGNGRDAQAERRDQLGEVARAVFERIESGQWELDALATALVDAVERRHLMVWGRAEAERDAWASIGVDGRLRPESLGVFLMNRSAAKLDSFVDTSGEVTGVRGPDGRIAITVSYLIDNGAPADGVPYVVGPNVEGAEAGEYRGIVVVNLPAGTSDIEVEGGRLILSGGDGPTVVRALEVSIPRGTSLALEVTAILPAGLEKVILEPSARVPWTRWEAEGRAFETERRRTLTPAHSEDGPSL